MDEAQNAWNNSLYDLTTNLKDTYVANEEVMIDNFDDFSNSAVKDQSKLVKKSKNSILQVNETIKQFAKDYQDFLSRPRIL